MIKKKLNGLLLLLLALLSLNLLNTTSLAFEPTKQELKNFFYNYALYYYGNTLDAETNATNLVNNLDDSRLDEWLGYISRYQGKYVLSAHNGKVFYWCYTGNVTNLQNHHALYINGYDNDKIGINNSYLSAWIWTYDLASNTFYNYQTSSDIQLTYIYNTSASQRNNWFYTDTNVWNYSNQQYQSIKWASGYMTPSNLFEGPNSDDTFTYARSEIDTELIDLDNTYYFNNQAESVLFAYNPFSGDEINEADGVIVGYLWDADKFDKAIFSRYNFNPTTRLFEYSGVTWESKNIGNIHDNMIWVELHARDYGNALKPDSIIHVEFVPNTTEFNHIHVDYYIRSPYSNIVDGKLNVGGTFSGDYSLMINNNNNTDKIINNVNDDSNVVGQLNDFVSGDTEDLAKKLGFQLIGGMDYYNFIQNTIRNTFNILSEEENVYFDYSMHGETPTRIYASNFTTPPSLFKTFGCMFLIACTIFVFYFQMTTFFESLATLQFTSAIDWLTIDRSIFRM